MEAVEDVTGGNNKKKKVKKKQNEVKMERG